MLAALSVFGAAAGSAYGARVNGARTRAVLNTVWAEKEKVLLERQSMRETVLLARLEALERMMGWLPRMGAAPAPIVQTRGAVPLAELLPAPVESLP